MKELKNRTVGISVMCDLSSEMLLQAILGFSSTTTLIPRSVPSCPRRILCPRYFRQGPAPTAAQWRPLAKPMLHIVIASTSCKKVRKLWRHFKQSKCRKTSFPVWKSKEGKRSNLKHTHRCTRTRERELKIYMKKKCLQISYKTMVLPYTRIKQDIVQNV